MRKIHFKVVQSESFSDGEVSKIEKRTIDGEDGKKLVVISVHSDDIDLKTMQQLYQKFKEEITKLNASSQVIVLALPEGTGETLEILEEVEGDPTT